ncbi:hypothetical protein Elgi_56190 [Paenibacillus elgii]|uniref:phosphotransferase family protein n=1 Tax=Paenibacillus elgii TaxID=189691 RepID=UPI002D7B33DB|nr:hypothetical protein Elgi_56190 [Paenibacillus elgii]
MLTMESYIHYIRQKHPEITRDFPIHVITEGSANIVLKVEGNDPWIFRIPREDNPAATSQMKREQILLTELKGEVPFIPQIACFSEHPIQYIGYPWIPGRQLFPPFFAEIPLVDKEILAKDLARFLSVLHEFPAASYFPAEEAKSSFGKQKWNNYLVSIQHYVFPYLNDCQKKWTLQLFHSFLSNEQHFNYSPCLINGDLKPEHILVNEQTYRLSGIIDPGLMMGDPALDFGYLGLGRPFQAMLLKHYTGFQDETFQDRITFYEKTIPFYGLRYGIIYNHQEAFSNSVQLLNEVIAGQ